MRRFALFLDISTVGLLIAILVVLAMKFTGQVHQRPMAPFEASRVVNPLQPHDAPAIVVVVNPGCAFCQRNSDFYKRLNTAIARSGGTSLVAVVPEVTPGTAAYIEGLGLRPRRTIQGTAARLGLPGTPAVFAVGRSGKVEGAWVGVIAELQEKEVMRHAKASAGFRLPFYE